MKKEKGKKVLSAAVVLATVSSADKNVSTNVDFQHKSNNSNVSPFVIDPSWTRTKLITPR